MASARPRKRPHAVAAADPPGQARSALLYVTQPVVKPLVEVSAGAAVDGFVARAMARTMDARKVESEYLAKLKGRFLVLDRTGHKRARRGTRAPAVSKPSARTAALRRLADPARTWEELEPLRTCWRQYADQLTAGANPPAALVTADLHGAELQVLRARCASLVGRRGTVVQVKPRALVVREPGSAEPSMWLKRGAVFGVTTAAGTFELNGNGMLALAGFGAPARSQQLSSRLRFDAVTLIDDAIAS